MSQEGRGPFDVPVHQTVLKPFAVAHDLWAHATMTAAEFPYFFLARISEICAQDARNHAKYIVCRKHITFCKAGVECEWFEHPEEDLMAVWFTKNLA